MKAKYIVLILLSLPSLIYAQSNFKKGYIITNENDTIQGWIDFRLDYSNCSMCRFKTSAHETEKLYYPGEIAGYRFEEVGKYYIPHNITINNLSRIVFLEFLVQGTMNLYFYSEPVSQQNYYFFENTEGIMYPVTKRPDRIIDDKVKKDNNYKGVLNLIFQDYPTLTRNLNSIRFDRKDMILLAKKYSELTCTPGNECIEFENDYKKQYIRVEFSVYAGLQLQRYCFKQREFPGFYNPESLFPCIGGQFNVSSPRLLKSLSLQVDASLSEIKGETERIYETAKTYQKYTFEAFSANAKLGFKYTYPSGKICPTIEAGYSITHLFNPSSTFYNETRGYEQSVKTETTKDKLLPQDWFMGWYAAIGINYLLKNENAILLRIGYENPEFKERPYNDNIKITHLKIGYIF